MQVNREAAIQTLKETAKHLSQAGKDAFAKEIDDIEKMIMRIENESLESISLPLVYSHLIMYAKAIR